MKTHHLLYCLLFIFCSCNQAVQQSENFDVVTINEYLNIYNSKGKLDSVKIVTKEYIYELDKVASLDIDVGLQEYTYRNDSLYSIVETYGLGKKRVTTTYFKDKSEETTTIYNQRDTAYYSLRIYQDSKKEMLEYERVIRRASGKPFLKIEINDDYEERSFYDNEHMTKKIRHDFNKDLTQETYYFKDTPYEEAMQMIPKSDNQQIISCHTSSNVNDTLVDKWFSNGEIELVTKKYKADGKEFERIYDADGHETLSFINYKENDMDISVLSSTYLGYSTDSTYTKNGNAVRDTKISDDSKRIVTYEYDSLGNITKRVDKIKFFN